MKKFRKTKQILIFVDMNLVISDNTNLKRVFEDTIDSTCTCSTKIRTNSHFFCIVFLNKIVYFSIRRIVITRTFFSRKTLRTDKVNTCVLNGIHFIN